MKKINLMLLTFGLILNAYAQEVSPKKLRIIASFTILQDITQNIVKDKAQVVSLVGYDQDPHGFEPKVSDATQIQNADVLILNGLGLEGWLNKASLDEHQKHPVKIIVSNGIKAQKFKDNDAKPNEGLSDDPHMWNDPQIVVQKYIPNIVKGLCTKDPVNCAAYTQNAEAYKKQITALDKDLSAKIIKLPHKDLVTTHDAFGYFARHYKINFYPVQGVSTDAEATPQDIIKIKQKIKEHQVKVVFLEIMTNQNLINTIAKESKVRIGAQLYSDGLSQQKNAPHTYLELLKYNGSTIVNELSKGK